MLTLFSFFSFKVFVSEAATPWLTKAQIIQNMKDLCNSHNGIASYASIGKTVLGNDIWLFRVGNNAKAKFLVDGATHGMELPGAHNVYFLLQWLLAGSAEANVVLSRMQVLLVPLVNYDRAIDPDHAVDSDRKNAHGVDINRNHIRGWSAVSDPNSLYYSGPYAASEPETQVINALFTSENPKVYVTIHDWGGAQATNGSFLSPTYGDSNYTTACNNLLAAYRVKVQSLYGLTGHVTQAVGAYGGSRDDGYNDGATLSYLWEETQSWTATPETVNYDVIRDNKALHLRAFTMAVADSYGADPAYWSSCDINHDLKIDMRDVSVVGRAFGTVPGDPLWNPDADITGIVPLVPDGMIDMKDLSLVAKHFGEHYP